MFDVQGLDGIPGPGNNNFKKEKNSGSAVPEIIMFADVQGPRSSANKLCNGKSNDERKAMPNWCDNTVSITGTEEVIKRLEEFVGRPVVSHGEKVDEPVFALGNIKPSTPDLDPKYAMFPSKGDDDWWSNNVNSWGTKWDVFGEGVGKSRNNGSVSYSFSSAWSPPTPVIERLAEIFPEVRIEFKYMETGMDFWGVEIYENGELVSEEGGSINHKAYEVMEYDGCYACQSYEEEGESEEYFEYLHDDCPPKVERLAKKKKRKKKETASA